MAPAVPATTTRLRTLWPMVAGSAEALRRSLDQHGLPRPSADYWEKREQATTLETAAATSLGLRAASRVAASLGEERAAAAWASSAQRVAAALAASFGATGYQRYVGHGGADAAIVFLAPPFAAASPAATAAVRATYRRLRLPNGGERPGEDWKHDGVAWTPETALFALSAAGRGDRPGAAAVLGWLQDHVTPLGSLPEKVLPDGRPASVAPLGWTCALVVLAVREAAAPLPIP